MNSESVVDDGNGKTKDTRNPILRFTATQFIEFLPRKNYTPSIFQVRSSIAYSYFGLSW